ncbi:DegT/DnrJ/EryC1/StrS family aminotransferase [Rhodococcus opacus]|uniref:Putative serine hydroxymethyltransferase n=1 Tax=Rhodococcus opacus (strain B4) TaxID=632772 RepID=C1B2G9_RHOOB|nr:DegT/DnrJ/EryC1/StrS family aminotransferase [Rhodococcus opacus]BAH50593.1 putative serine hydroxymethyltransferase [Rhodococcus opacus B4]
MKPRSTIAPWASPIAQERLSALEHLHTEDSAAQVVESVHRALTEYHARIDDGIVLYAGTNVLSPNVTALHDTALSTRPALGWPGEKVQTAVQEIEHLEVIAARQVAASMRGTYAEVRYLTATMANLAAYIAFTEPGDTIAVLSPESGGHASHQQSLGTAGIRGLTVEHLPYSPSALDIDAGEISDFVYRVRPRLIVVGGSVTLFPHNLDPIREAADRVGAVLVYDASHTAGLIAAGYYQDPLAEGADVVTFSTYKTYAGPAGGAAVTHSAEYAERLAEAAYPTMLSNYDPARLGPLAIAAREAIEQAPAWAAATIEYAGELAANLNAHGLIVVGRRLGYTRSHQIVIDAQRLGGAPVAVRRLEAAGIYTGACRLPWQTPGSSPEGVRLGVQEFIRRGAGFDTVTDLADLIYRSLTTSTEHPLAQDTRLLRHRVTTDLWGRPATAPSPEEWSVV